MATFPQSQASVAATALPPLTGDAERAGAIDSPLSTGEELFETFDALDPYAAILALAERELELARDGRIEDLRALASEWDELTAGLPEQPPATARGALERAAALHERTSATLMSLREAMLCDLRTTARASRAAHGYAGQSHRRIRRIDQSA
jgi:hypothetical protein